METNLTKTIKRKLISSFPNILPSKMRTARWATEVWTPSGVCDVIKAEDYLSGSKEICEFDHMNDKMKSFYKTKPCGDASFKNEHCKTCWHKKISKVYDSCITCFEIKITVSDFKSKNGHNFHGNYNYYVVPKEIYTDISPLVKDNIGVITYSEKGLRRAKKPIFQEIDAETKSFILYNMLKKWVAKDDAYSFYFADSPQDKQIFIDNFSRSAKIQREDKIKDLDVHIYLDCESENLTGYKLGQELFNRNIKKYFKPKKFNRIYLPHNTKSIEISFVKGIIDNVLKHYQNWEDLMYHFQFVDYTYDHRISDLATNYEKEIFNKYLSNKMAEKYIKSYEN